MNLWEFTEKVSKIVGKRYPDVDRSKLFTNSVSKQLFPEESATYLALAIYELLDNTFQHAFVDQQPPYFIGVDLTKTGYDENDLPTWILGVTDSGVGIPEIYLSEKPNTAGFRILRKLAKELDAELIIENSRRGTRVSMIHKTDGQEPPSPDVTTL